MPMETNFNFLISTEPVEKDRIPPWGTLCGPWVEGRVHLSLNREELQRIAYYHTPMAVKAKKDPGTMGGKKQPGAVPRIPL